MSETEAEVERGKPRTGNDLMTRMGVEGAAEVEQSMNNCNNLTI
jgi:hypothetical protein